MLATFDLELVLVSLQNAPDSASAIKIGEVLLKLFNGLALLNHFLGPVIFKICKKTFSEDAGKLLAMRAIK